MLDRAAHDVTTPKSQCPRFTALAAAERKLLGTETSWGLAVAGTKTKVPMKLRARACFNPLDQAATAFGDALGVLLRVTFGCVSFLPGATHVSVVKFHGLGHQSPLSDDASIAALPDRTR